MGVGGRPRDPIWGHFREVVIDGKTLAKCNSCGQQATCKVLRIKTHYEKCCKQSTSRDATPTSVPATAKCIRDDSDYDVDSLPPAKKAAIQSHISGHLTKTDSTTKARLDQIVIAMINYY